MPEKKERFQEESLIVQLLSGQERKIHLPASGDRFIALCEFHGVSSIILEQLQKRGISGGSWEGILEKLQGRKRQWLARNIYLLNRLRSFSAILRKAGVPNIVLKGGSLLGVLYSDFGLRPLADVDVLVRRGDVDRILGLLGRDGWVIPSQDRIAYWKERYYHLYVQTEDAFLASFELHWNLEKEFRHAIQVEELWERSVTFHLEGEPLKRLSNEDLMLHLLVHLAHHYFRPRLIWVYDIPLLAGSSFMDWDRVLARAERWRLRLPVFYALSYVQKIFPGALPQEALEGGKAGWLRRIILRAAGTANPLALTVPLEGPVLRLPFSLYFVEKPGDMIKFLWRNVGPKVGEITRRRQAS